MTNIHKFTSIDNKDVCFEADRRTLITSQNFENYSQG